MDLSPSDWVIRSICCVFVLSALISVVRFAPLAAHHGASALAIVMLATLVSLVAPHIFGSWVEMLQTSEITQPLLFVTSLVRPLSTANVLAPTDVLCVSVLFYTAYAVVVVFRRLVDTTRILKVSRRRMVFSSVAGK